MWLRAQQSSQHKPKRYWILWSLLAVLIAYSLHHVGVSMDKLLSAFASMPITLYVLLLSLSLLSYGCRFTRWCIFLKPLQPSLSILIHLRIYFAGFAFTATPGKVGETIRSVYLRYCGITIGSSLAAFFCERLLDLLVVLLLSSSIINAFELSSLRLFMVATACIGLIALLRSKLLSQRLSKLMTERLGSNLYDFNQAARQFLSWKQLSLALPLGGLAWLCQGVSLVLIVRYFDFQGAALMVVAVYSLSILAGAVSFVPGGLGATEASMMALLIWLGMEPSEALAAALVSRVMTLWFAIALGVCAWLSLVLLPLQES